MGSSRQQVLRIMKFYAEMKNNEYPNAKDFSEEMQEEAWNRDVGGCNQRTIERDIKILRDEYRAPMEFDRVQNGYRLTDPSWELAMPILCEEHITHFLISARLAADFVPEPLRREMGNAVIEAQTTNSSEFLDKAFLDTLLVASGQKTHVEPSVFQTLFDGWRTLQRVRVRYSKPNEGEVEREIEPHIIAFHNGIWYVKGYAGEKRELRVLAMQRIVSAKLLESETFAIDKQLLLDTKRKGLFEYPKLEGVKLRCAASIAFYLKEHQPVKKFKLEPQENGDVIITLGPAIEHEVIRWVLGEGGRISILHPPELRAKISEAGRRIVEANTPTSA